MSKNEYYNQIEVDVPIKKRKYKLNKLKFFIAMAIICLFIAVVIIVVSLISDQNKQADAGQNGNMPVQNGDINESGNSEPIGENALIDRLIVIDAGHGGFDPGASGNTGTREDELNLNVAAFLKAELEALGAKVIMTRSDDNALADNKDADMAQRRKIIGESSSDIVVSIHMNSFTDSSASGPLVIFMDGSVKGEKLAILIQDEMNEMLEPPTANKARSGDLFILRSGEQPCVIVECGYLSNPDEEKKLLKSDYQKMIAKAVCRGIALHFSE